MWQEGHGRAHQSSMRNALRRVFDATRTSNTQHLFELSRVAAGEARSAGRGPVRPSRQQQQHVALVRSAAGVWLCGWESHTGGRGPSAADLGGGGQQASAPASSISSSAAATPLQAGVVGVCGSQPLQQSMCPKVWGRHMHTWSSGSTAPRRWVRAREQCLYLYVVWWRVFVCVCVWHVSWAGSAAPWPLGPPHPYLGGAAAPSMCQHVAALVLTAVRCWRCAACVCAPKCLVCGSAP